MTGTDYQDYAASLAPVWLRSEEAQADIRARAYPLDQLLLKARTIALIRLVSHAPDDVLLMIGRERGIRRFPGEPSSVYRKRVAAAWDWWRLAGTRPGMIKLLELCGYRATVTEHFGEPGHFHEFSIHLNPVNPLVKDAIWGKANQYGDSKSHWGYRLDAVPLSSMRELIDEIKPAHARLRLLTYSTGTGVWGGTDTWGNTATISTGHGYGYPWGMPSVTFQQTGDAKLKWGDGAVQVIYDLYGEFQQQGDNHE